MKRSYRVAVLILAVVVAAGFLTVQLTTAKSEFTVGSPEIKSMGTLAFSPDGVLFIGDSRGGTIYAIDLDDKKRSNYKDEVEVPDIEAKIAAMLGTTADDVLIHDFAVNPISKNAYISVSRGRGKWSSAWELPNDLDDARVLMKVTPEGKIDEVSLRKVRYASASLPNPVDMNKKHMWKDGAMLRSDAITDIVYSDGKLFVAGLSNEEFASTMWQIPFPFGGDASYSTLEIFHGAHGEYETHAPVRTFVPYKIKNEPHLLASYLCTPLVSFPISDLKNEQHVKGMTVAEFGSGNFPLDMVLFEWEGKEQVLMANSALPLLTFDPKDVAKQARGITEKVPTYTAGVQYTARSGAGVQQLAAYNDKYILALRRMPNGKMDLVSLSTEWLAR